MNFRKLISLSAVFVCLPLLFSCMYELLNSLFAHIMSGSWSSVTYVVGVESCCFGSSCIEQTNFKAIVDSGSSFTFLPDQIYDRVVKEVSLHLLAALLYFKVQYFTCPFPVTV